MFIIVAMVVAIISALFWLYEIKSGLKNAEEIICGKKSLIWPFTAGPRILIGFVPFLIDLGITSFFIAFFGISGVTGFIVGCAVSDIFSIAIVIEMIKRKGGQKIEVNPVSSL